MPDLSHRVRAAIELERDLADEHHLGVCTIWAEGWRLKPGPCNCYGPAGVRRHCEADLEILAMYQTAQELVATTSDTMLAAAADVCFGAYEKVLAVLARSYNVEVSHVDQ